MVVRIAEIDLCAGMTLFGCSAEPGHRLNVVLRDAFAIIV